jgi:hypothetical protein
MDYSCELTIAGAACILRDTITVEVNPVPVLSFPDVKSICVGDTAILDAGNFGSTYLWSTNETSQSISSSVDGEVNVVVTGANGCVSSDTVLILVNPLPTVAFSEIGDLCVYNNAITLNQGSPAGGSYSGTAVTGGNFNPSVAGAGTHVLTYFYADANGCENTDTSEVFVDECLSVNEHSMSVLTVYPNPFQNSTTITLNQSVELNQVLFEVYDMTGKRVMVLNPRDYTFEFHRGNLENGMYHYGLISNGKSIRTGKLILE